MFDSVLTRGPQGRLGSGAIISAAVHAGVLVGALAFTAHHIEKKDESPLPTIHFLGSHDAMGGPARTTIEAKGPVPKRTHAHRKIVQPLNLVSTAVPVAAAAPSEPVAPDDGDESDDPSSEPQPGMEIGRGSGPGSGTGTGNGLAGTGAGIGATVFDPMQGMTQPVLISGPSLDYTREALEARVEGSMIAKCVITTEGRLEQCHILRPLPFLTQSVLTALAERRYRPVTYDGKPISVEYVFYFRFKLPR